jgi:hypothetical protein
VQQQLLNDKAYLLPYIDVKPSDSHFIEIQKVGATGILKGVGVPYQWANQTWFYPQMPVNEVELFNGFTSFYGSLAGYTAIRQTSWGRVLCKAFYGSKSKICRQS